MTITQMLQQSGLLTVLGMGVVFVFLAIMIILMHALHAVVHAFHLDKDVCGAQQKPGQINDVKNTDDEVVAAVAAAIHKDEK
ncbi:MAG TPA: sodium pump decarboxylase subunit gamma [Treponema sp.]|nr:sodium pump decarboxylase subunit gamma [Treponema sp.]